MNQAFEISGVGLQAQQKALDVIANNIANLNTPGFKRSDVTFTDLISQQRDPSNPSANLDDLPSVAGVTARPTLTLDEQGELDRTGNSMDLAIQGAGFIELMGAHGQSMLWRGGTLSVQQDGMLGTGDGLALRAMISVPTSASGLSISSDGVVTAQLPGQATPAELGRIMLTQVDDPKYLERLDGGFYRVSPDVHLRETSPADDGAATFVQGAIERSNVNINDEMVRLMIVQRAYGANAQVVSAADQIAGIANNLRR